MISRFLPLLLALVAFVVTLAIENWPQPDSGQPSRRSAVENSSTGAGTHNSPMAQRSFVSARVDSVTPKPSPPRSGPRDSRPEQAGSQAAGGDMEPAPVDPAQQPVPVLVQLERPTAESAETIATLQNRGSKHLRFSISTVDATGAIHSSIEISAPPHKWESLNEQGLLILPGDQIVVKSPPYQDYVVSTK